MARDGRRARHRAVGRPPGGGPPRRAPGQPGPREPPGRPTRWPSPTTCTPPSPRASGGWASRSSTPTRPRRSRPRPSTRWWSRPAPPRGSRCASTCRSSTCCARTRAPGRSTSTRPRRWPRTRRARCTRFGLKALRPAIYDGDTPRAERAAIRKRANVVLTNPDMLHVGILPNHGAWGELLLQPGRRRRRRGARLPGRVRLARGQRPAPAAAHRRRLRDERPASCWPRPRSPTRSTWPRA